MKVQYIKKTDEEYCQMFEGGDTPTKKEAAS